MRDYLERFLADDRVIEIEPAPKSTAWDLVTMERIRNAMGSPGYTYHSYSSTYLLAT